MKTRVWFFLQKRNSNSPYNSYETVSQDFFEDLDFIPRIGEYVECFNEVSGFVAHVQHCMVSSDGELYSSMVINIYLVSTKLEIEGFLQ